jgi:hypothetical protein
MSNCKPQPPLFVQRPRRNHPNYNREYDFEYSNHKNSDHTYPVHHNYQLHHGLWLRQANGLPCTFLSRRHHNLDSALYLSLARRNRHHDHLLRLCPIYTSILPPTCESSLSCPTVTATAPPQCPPITTAGCITPDCALISTLPIPCGCTGIQTVNECNGKCPTGCETFYTGLGLPCPLTAIEQL